MKKVLFLHAQVKQYRAPFFEKLHAALREEGIELTVGYSAPNKIEAKKHDTVELPSEYGLKVKGYWTFGSKVFYQPLLRQAAKADLIVAEQANKYLLNYLLLLLPALGRQRIAFWGLGENKQSDRTKLSEWLRRKIASKVDWWFAYTPSTTEYLISNHVPAERITTVNNSIDTRAFSELLASIPNEELQLAKERLGIEAAGSTGLFCGVLGADKGLKLLFESVQLVKQRLPNFHLLIVGNGPERAQVEQATQVHSWIHYFGPKFGREKALVFRMADILLLPGRAGLVILDAFAAGMPLLTTKIPNHGPEIEYLENGRNGLMTEPEAKSFAQAVVNVLSNPLLLAELKDAALESAGQYCLEAMVENCKHGILCCLGLNQKGILTSSTEHSRTGSRSEESVVSSRPTL